GSLNFGDAECAAVKAPGLGCFTMRTKSATASAGPFANVRFGSKANKALAEIFASVKLRDCPRAMFDPVNDILAITQTTIADPVGQSSDGLFITMLVVENEKSRHPRTLYEKGAFDARSGRRGIPTRDRSGPADDHACARGKLR